jgi:GDP-L-fucose synthase
MKKILITGARGLVGSAIKKIEKKYNYYFIHLDSSICDLTNYEKTKKYFDYIKPDIIIHLAACVGGLYKNMNDKVKMFEDNILINTNIIKCAYQCNVKTLIACLSTCIFPDSKSVNEDSLHDGPPHKSNEGYAYAKRMLEIHCKLYNEQFNTNYSCIIPTNIYGPEDNYNLDDSHVIPGLIHRCYLAKKESQQFIVKGTGKSLRQFIYSMDLAKLIFIVLENGIGNIILSPTEEYSIKEVVEIICEKLNYHNVIFDSSFSDGQYRKTADNSKLIKLIKLIGNFEFTDLKVGISETIDYFIENYNTLRK